MIISFNLLEKEYGLVIGGHRYVPLISYTTKIVIYVMRAIGIGDLGNEQINKGTKSILGYVKVFV